LPRLLDISWIHLQVSRAGTITQLIAFIILLDGRNDWTPELYGEMAQLLSSISNIESADVPVALKVDYTSDSTSNFMLLSNGRFDSTLPKLF
jgi:hypothetical protein